MKKGVHLKSELFRVINQAAPREGDVERERERNREKEREKEKRKMEKGALFLHFPLVRFTYKVLHTESSPPEVDTPPPGRHEKERQKEREREKR